MNLALDGGAGAGMGGGAGGEKVVRRRSSKACDQCRKSKCKCERAADGEACKSCVMLGTACTFLGPSRKRGPPKGYIDAIEARLHQTEALLGVIIGSGDERARGVVRDLGADTLAREIINRVDNSPYGAKGRAGKGGVGAKGRASGATSAGAGAGGEEVVDLQSTHPSNEWQDRVATLLAPGPSRPSASHRPPPALSPTHPLRPPQAPALSPTLPYPSSSSRGRVPLSDPHRKYESEREHRDRAYEADRYGHESERDRAYEGERGDVRRQRRKVDEYDIDVDPAAGPSTSGPGAGTSGTGEGRGAGGSPSTGYSPVRYSPVGVSGAGAGGAVRALSAPTSLDSDSDEDVLDAVGQLSLNEDEQVRYHGKASGLYLLGINARPEARNEGGIWRFPKARVWPPVPGHAPSALEDDEFASKLPDAALQEHLLELYFTYVHPVFPVLHKAAFWESYRNGGRTGETPESPASDGQRTSPSPFHRARQRPPPLLLLAMFSIAARYSTSSASSPLPPPSSPAMWTAGDEYLAHAKIILDSTYASSRASTCQALLLLGFREVGIGAMAQAWVYVGMAVRMAQDLGLHRCADGWARVGLGGRLFGEWELQERRRIWFGCVGMDGYVATYIGRPLAIFERDYDTLLPGETEAEELELWAPHPSPTIDMETRQPIDVRPTVPVPGRVLSCFNASASLSGLLSMIVQAIYAIRPASSRHAESLYLGGLLNKWYLDLPAHLRYDPSSVGYGSSSVGAGMGAVPPPHILTLHMQYWCTTLLLHRPFIRYMFLAKQKTEGVDDAEVRATAKKNYELCVGAANHIASIVSVYREKYCLQRAPVFLCFYVFTAGITHVTSLSMYANDPQARLGLLKCIDALQDMEVVWPSAGRARELLRGSDVMRDPSSTSSAITSSNTNTNTTAATRQDRQKRAAEHAVDGEDAYERMSWRATSAFMSPPDFHSASPPSAGAGMNPASAYFPSYERWPADNAGYLSFPGTLSTSVLPQMYSTGLIEPRVSSQRLGGGGGGGYDTQSAGGHGHAGGGGGGGRYPQFWNDYTSFPQMGMAYAPAGGEQHPEGAGTGPGSGSVYLSGGYGNIYNGHQSS
ncbi:fungal-specific transcription factor domain-containing protein [Hygrophoropsis aurantiaca]|uniref:Fungal-specific transcription factor domain-containing protein n=1 Tax=Hygrophoropsis aurantiaca TaxID=72124 RepID=A0ACB8AD78_9AGAM|nr:fungal-specific transcription factor domain-containing protein [Hygrophoropsis aurantiaca]